MALSSLLLLLALLQLILYQPLENVITPSNKTIPSSLDLSITNSTRKMGWDYIADPLFDSTGLYISEGSVLSPLIFIIHMLRGAEGLRGVFLAAMGDTEERRKDSRTTSATSPVPPV